jgi:hypothetical protein
MASFPNSSTSSNDLAQLSNAQLRELVLKERLERASGPGRPKSDQTAMLTVLTSIKSKLANKNDDKYACPQDLFMRAVYAWLEGGRLVDPHVLSPTFQSSLKSQTPTKDGYKLLQDPYMRIDCRDIGEWLDGCQALEELWAASPSHKHLVGSLHALRSHLQRNKGMTDSMIIEVTKNLMKDFPDPRKTSWLEEYKADASRIVSQCASA